MNTKRALTTTRRRLLGVAFLMSAVMFLSLTVAIYQKAFTSTVDVVLQAPSTGNQLMPDSDVKVRGLTVGRVSDIRSEGDGAELDLKLEPQFADRLPANLSARLLPQTLFGERYVSLELPDEPSGAQLASGDVITQDRTSASVELEEVLADTMPVLQAVQPQELAATLNAVDQALDGRGESIGQSLEQLNGYLEEMNPSIPDLQRNLQELVGVAETYEEAAPDVVQALENFSTTSRTLVEQRESLDELTGQVTTTAEDATRFTTENRENIITLGEAQRPTLDVLSKYAPAYPCFLNQMSRLVPEVRKTFGEGTDEPGLHVTLEIVSSRGKYYPNQDEPEFADKRGPRCYDLIPLPKPMPEYPPDGPFKDGSVPPAPSRPIDGGLNPPSMGEDYLPESSGAAGTAPQSARALGEANSPQESDMVSGMLAPAVGRPAEEVPDWGALLVGPALRGAEVSYR
ncbi:MCE family protein [Saccharopolyspora sp. HNM0983]|uniref:MCE family protein n=1 Tax=Saccharopolyspora montiporae TaxID=2781240 RepID=A0A929BCE7_9PSEU|nr:MCE family protein [Saccharopolyspora sp. HNM0983]MBE9374952.1 MCE family protein [Saccharopolyspora sp. HNM0983]